MLTVLQSTLQKKYIHNLFEILLLHYIFKELV